jgi:[2Fe-2S] binding domain
MLLACKVFLLAYPKPTREQIDRYLNGNICSCGAYVQILEAIQDVVEARQGDALARHGRLRVATRLPMQPRPINPSWIVSATLSTHDSASPRGRRVSVSPARARTRTPAG